MHSSKKKELSIKLLHLEHLNRTALSKMKTGGLIIFYIFVVEAARTMLSASKLPLFFWAEAIATACYTQNRSIIIPTHEKTAYHIINDRKHSIKHLHIFGCTCYLTKDGENLDKMKEKGDPCILVGYSTQSKGYRVFNKRTRLIVESIHLRFDEIKEMSETSVANDTSGLVPQRQKASDYDNPDPAPELQNQSSEELHQLTDYKSWELVDKPLRQERKRVLILESESFAPVARWVGCQAFLSHMLHTSSGSDLTLFSADIAACLDTRKSTSGGIQFLGDKLVSWMSKKQNCTAMSSAEAEYVALSASYAQKGFQYLVRGIVTEMFELPAELEGRMPTKIELTLEQSQQGVSNDVLVSIEGVEELKRNVWIKGEKNEALHTQLRAEKPVHKLLTRVLRSQAVNKSPTHYPCDSARTFRVILFSIHNDEWKSFQCHHQTALRSYALSWKPCQGDSLNLPDHRIHKDGDGDASFQLESNSLPHAHAQTTKTFYKHQDSRIMKAQELKTKTSAQTLIYKIFLQRYQVYQGRLLASFQDDAKYEHVGQDTRSQGGKDDQDKQGKDLKISDIKTKSKDNDKGSRSKITKHEGTSLQ
ncbi:retrovirus-related pol polyprotein from transposon TNT 1-94 [Tanacetum coccineum]